MLAGSKQSSMSCFEKVTSITVNEKRHVIYINERFSHNQVYADSADFAFVKNTIIGRCKNAKVTYGNRQPVVGIENGFHVFGDGKRRPMAQQPMTPDQMLRAYRQLTADYQAKRIDRLLIRRLFHN